MPIVQFSPLNLILKYPVITWYPHFCEKIPLDYDGKAVIDFSPWGFTFFKFFFQILYI